MSPDTIVAIGLFAVSAGCAIFVLGAFYEYDRKGGSHDLFKQLRKEKRANDELRDAIWFISQETPSSSGLMPAGALPNSTVRVERSRHLFTVTPKNGGGA